MRLRTFPKHFYLFINILFPLILGCYSEKAKKEGVIFRYNEDNGISSLDPLYARDQAHWWVVSQLFNGLVSVDSSLNIVPSLAKNWEIKEGGIEYVFHIRTDARFHNHPAFKGKPRFVGAHDFHYSFERLLDPVNASPGTWVLRGKLDSLKPFSTPDDSTLIIRLAKPYAPFIKLLAMPYCVVVPKEVILAEGKEFGRNPSGTGPFIFKFWEDGVRLVLERNEQYFESSGEHKIPQIAGVEISFIENKQAAFMEFAGGRLDFMNGIDASFKDEVLTHSGELKPYYARRFKSRKAPYLSVEYLGFQLQNPDPQLLGNTAFRRALSMAINKDDLVRFLRNGVGIAAYGGILPSSFADNSNGYGHPFDRTAGIKILDSLKGKGIEIPVLILNTTKASLELAVFIQKQWEKTGITCKIEVSPGASLRQKIAAGKISVFRASWIADYPDAENFLALLYSENEAPNGPNYTRYSNESFDALLKSANTDTNQLQRTIKYRQADSLAMRDCPIIPLYYAQSFHLMQHRVKYLPINAMNLLDLRFAVVE